MATEIKRLHLTGMRLNMPRFVSDTEPLEVVLYDDGVCVLKTGDTVRELVQSHVFEIENKQRGNGLDAFWSAVAVGTLLLMARLPVWAAGAYLVAALVASMEAMLQTQMFKPALVFDTPYPPDHIGFVENKEPAEELGIVLYHTKPGFPRTGSVFVITVPPSGYDAQALKEFVAAWERFKEPKNA